MQKRELFIIFLILHKPQPPSCSVARITARRLLTPSFLLCSLVTKSHKPTMHPPPPTFACRWSRGISLFSFHQSSSFWTFSLSLTVVKFCLVPPRSHCRQSLNEPLLEQVDLCITEPLIYSFVNRACHSRFLSPFVSCAPELTAKSILLLQSRVGHFCLSLSQVAFWYLLSCVGLVCPNEYFLDLK